MAWMRCRSCTALFAIGLLRCPQCQAMSELYARPDYEEDQEESVPKTTLVGASNALLGREPGSVAVQEPVPAPAVETDAAPAEDGMDAVAEDEPVTDAGEPEPVAAPAPKKRAAKKTAAPPA